MLVYCSTRLVFHLFRRELSLNGMSRIFRIKSDFVLAQLDILATDLQFPFLHGKQPVNFLPARKNRNLSVLRC